MRHLVGRPFFTSTTYLIVEMIGGMLLPRLLHCRGSSGPCVRFKGAHRGEYMIKGTIRQNHTKNEDGNDHDDDNGNDDDDNDADVDRDNGDDSGGDTEIPKQSQIPKMKTIR